MTIPSSDIKVLVWIRNSFSVLIFGMSVTWLWATNQENWLKDYMEPAAMVTGGLIALVQFLIRRWSSVGLISELESEIKMKRYGAVDEDVRNYLKKRYSSRLKQKLANRQPVNLRRILSTEGTSEDTAESFVTVSADEIREHIADDFRTAQGRLLITGKPGSGKTVLLLQLELALLESETDQLPVILNLSTWKKDYITLETWLKEILPAEMGVSKKYASDVLEQKRLLLLLDGLDEVEERDRLSCLEAIGRYRATTEARYVITSRTGEYIETGKDAPVNLQIEVGDLTIQQMEEGLKRLGHNHAGAMPLLTVLQKHPLLREAAQVPFYFNTLQLLFAANITLADLQLKGNTVEDIQEELTPRFVSYALTISPDKEYTREEAARWLSFLADNMNRRNKVVFELADLQYDWAPAPLSRWQVKRANIIGSYGIAPIFGFVFLFVNIILGLIVFGKFNIMGSFYVFFLSVTVGALIVTRQNNVIEIREGNTWSWRVYFGFAQNRIVNGVTFGLIFGIILSTFRGCFIIYSKNGECDLIVIFAMCIFLGIAIGPFLGILFSLVVGGLDYLRSSSNPLVQLTHPYQRFKNSAMRMHFSILQHWHLVYIFSRKGWLPRRLVPFLNDMVAQQILESPEGATWRFRHRILQEYFAGRWG